jgi:hypothetical protein
MAQEAARASDIITRTTALFRKDTHRERVNIRALIGEMAILLQQEASASSIAIRAELAFKGWPCHDRQTYEGNAKARWVLQRNWDCLRIIRTIDHLETVNDSAV